MTLEEENRALRKKIVALEQKLKHEKNQHSICRQILEQEIMKGYRFDNESIH